jgi:hypothetical protein
MIEFIAPLWEDRRLSGGQNRQAAFASRLGPRDPLPPPSQMSRGPQILRGSDRLKDIPGAIVHGRYDMACPVRNAFELHRAWPRAEFHLIEGAGHAFSETGILDRLLRFTDAFAVVRGMHAHRLASSSFGRSQAMGHGLDGSEMVWCWRTISGPFERSPPGLKL